MTTPLKHVDSGVLPPSSSDVSESSAGETWESQADHAAALPPATPARGARRWVNSLLWGGLFVGTAATSAVLGALVALTVPLPSFGGMSASQPSSFGDLWQSGFRYQVSRPVNILVMGIDEVLEAQPNSDDVFAGRTDTLLLVRVDPETGHLNVMSIPRDTRVQIPGFGMDKINQANVLGGPELVAQTIGYNLGDIPIDRYVRVNTTAFREIVDLVGGVEINVPKRMEYTDRTQGLYIDLYPGWQTLNGDQAEQFARFRQENGDIGRVQRQQMLLRALRERLTNPTVIPKLPQAVRVALRYVDTNLTLEEMLAIANFGLEMEPDQLQMVMLPGRFSTDAEFIASYWLPDWDGSASVVQDFFQAGNVGVYADGRQGRYVTDMAIAVQNASGNPDQATEVARYLRDNGFKNVYIVDNWAGTLAQTEVLAQQGDINSARLVESLLGVGRSRAESTGSLGSDITIRVGRDWGDQVNQDPSTSFR
jgi:LCP family protein required for cell wall assembly